MAETHIMEGFRTGQVAKQAGVGIETFGTGPAEFDAPGGVAVGAGGHLYVADFYNHRIQVLSPAGSLLRQYGSAQQVPSRCHPFHKFLVCRALTRISKVERGRSIGARAGAAGRGPGTACWRPRAGVGSDQGNL